MTLRNEVEDVIKEFFGKTYIEDNDLYYNGIEDMALAIIRLRTENTRLGWIESPDRMGS